MNDERHNDETIDPDATSRIPDDATCDITAPSPAADEEDQTVDQPAPDVAKTTDASKKTKVSTPEDDDPDATLNLPSDATRVETAVSSAQDDDSATLDRSAATAGGAGTRREDTPARPAADDTRMLDTLDSTDSGPAQEARTGGAGRSLTAADQPGHARRQDVKLPPQVSRYETISCLGEGSFGIVLKSRDPNLDRLVAVKLQKGAALHSRSNVDRFLREARSAAQLRHPHIIPVFEYGNFADNQFIVYQFIDGQTLDEWIGDTGPDVREMVEVLARIADALDYAHSLGIVHRDIKPANIMVDRDHEQPHVADFGCARLDQTETTRTIEGSLMGTPAYMSPEVVAGHANTADGRADLWALGVMLYEFLTGERPFRGKLSELFRLIQESQPKRLRQLNPDIPRDLETICLKSMEKEPDRRFATCGEFAQDLRLWLDGMPITSRRTGVIERTWLWAKRKPAIAAMLGIIAAFLVVVAAGSTLFSMNLQQKQNEIVRSQLEALENADPGSLPVIIDSLVQLDDQVVDRLETRLQDPDTPADKMARYQLAAYRIDKHNGTVDESVLQSLAGHLNDTTPVEARTIIELTRDDLGSQSEYLWQVASQDQDKQHRLRAFCALAAVDPGNPAWEAHALPLLGYLLDESSERLAIWTQLLKPVADRLQPNLENVFYQGREASVRERAAELISYFFADDLPYLTKLAERAEPQQLRWFAEPARQHAASMAAASVDDLPADNYVARANLILLKTMAGDPSALSAAFGQTGEDSSLRSKLVNDCGSAGIDLQHLREIVLGEADGRILMAAILALGEYDQRQLYQVQREEFKHQLLDLFATHRSAGVHSACRWLLERWGFAEDVRHRATSVQQPLPEPDFEWHEDPNGYCFAVFESVEEFRPGAGADGPVLSIPYRFGIAMHEMTVGDYREWEDQLMADWLAAAERTGDPDLKEKYESLAKAMSRNQKNRETPLDPAQPVAAIPWHDVALYCNELSRRAGLGDQAAVYALKTGRHSWTALPVEEALQRTGYRMPTGVEWEYASRAGSDTRYFYGQDEQLFSAYGWSVNNSGNQPMPVGSLKPNDFGLFDVQGNVSEWCHNVIDTGKGEISTLPRETRGQSCQEEAGDIRIFFPGKRMRVFFATRLGFRLARTYPAHGESD
ncbi:MAG: protein kinase domain-containing protein [Pirellulaceae bacterium]